jgi:hypothetical protein
MPGKSNKKDRVNAFILGGAQARATEQVRAYLSKNNMQLGELKDEAFTTAMNAIERGLMQMYSTAMCDTLDVVEGRPLTEIK